MTETTAAPMQTRERRSRVVQTIIVIVVVIVALNLVAVLLDQLAGPEPEGPPSSSYATIPDGLAAYATLLTQYGHPVERLRGRIGDDELRPGTTLVLADAVNLAEDERNAISRFVRAGGRLVVAGGELADEPQRTDDRVALARPPVPVAETTGVETVMPGEAGAWEQTAAALPILTGEDGVFAAVVDRGQGRIVFLAAAGPLRNSELAVGDNAAFGLAIVGGPGRTVVFAEGVHGFGREEGFAAIPAAWRWTAAGLLLAGLVWLLALGRRVGPPTDEVRPLPPPRREYVEAVAATLRRTKRRAEAIAPVRDAVRRRITRRTGLDPHAGDAALRNAARELGLAEEDVRRAFAPDPGEEGVLAAGRLLAQLEPRSGGRP